MTVPGAGRAHAVSLAGLGGQFCDGFKQIPEPYDLHRLAALWFIGLVPEVGRFQCIGLICAAHKGLLADQAPGHLLA